MLPGGAMSELIGGIGALQLITKDQIMNLAVEILPPARVRELMSHLGVLVGFQANGTKSDIDAAGRLGT